MHSKLTLIALLFSIPTYGISLLLHLILSMVFKDKSKDTMFRNHITRSLSKGKIVDVNMLHWKDALHYAQQEGKDLMSIEEMISFYIYLQEEKTYVLIVPILNGGISISAHNRKPQKEVHSSLYPY